MRRLLSARRILSVQRQLQRQEERKLADLQRREAAARTEQEEIIRSLNEKEVLHGLFVFAMAKRMRSLDEQVAALEREKQGTVRRLMEQARKRKRAETLFESVNDAWRREADKRELLEVIERAAGKPDASLP
jgi:hypothetical protein